MEGQIKILDVLEASEMIERVNTKLMEISIAAVRRVLELEKLLIQKEKEIESMRNNI